MPNNKAPKKVVKDQNRANQLTSTLALLDYLEENQSENLDQLIRLQVLGPHLSNLLYTSYLIQNRNLWPELFREEEPAMYVGVKAAEALAAFYLTQANPPLSTLIEKVLNSEDERGLELERLRRRIEMNLEHERPELRATYQRLKAKKKRSLAETLFLAIYNFARALPAPFRSLYGNGMESVLFGESQPYSMTMANPYCRQKHEVQQSELNLKHFALAHQYFKEAGSDPRAAYYLGALYTDLAERANQEINNTRAFHYFYSAAKKDHTAAKVAVFKWLLPMNGELNLAPELVSKPHHKYALILDAAKDNNIEALHYLAENLLTTFMRGLASKQKSLEYLNLAILLYSKIIALGELACIPQFVEGLYQGLMSGLAPPKEAQGINADSILYLFAYLAESGQPQVFDTLVAAIGYAHERSYTVDTLSEVITFTEQQLQELEKPQDLAEINRLNLAFKGYRNHVEDKSDGQYLSEGLTKLASSLRKKGVAAEPLLAKLNELVHLFQNADLVKGEGVKQANHFCVDLSGLKDPEPEVDLLRLLREQELLSILS